jgi:glycyl-tRNA synthetase
MFKTEIGSTGGDIGYARPEPAQGMFINFRRGYLQAREKIPFALAQVGKVLRNEISPRRGIVRLREFTIMELELFFDPLNPSCPIETVSDEVIRLLTEEMLVKGVNEPLEIRIEDALKQNLIRTEWQAYFMGVGQRFVSFLGVSPKNQRFRAHLPEERAHYSIQTFDHEALLDAWGWTEIAGYAYRTDYDLKAHQKGSGEEFKVLRDDGTRYTPHVVEPSFGLSRLLYMVMEANYERRNKRNLFKFPRELSPFHASVFPLVTKDGLPEKTREITAKLVAEGFTVFYDDRGSIGRRYARSDEAGIPLALTIDYDTLKDNSITIRDRNSWHQVRTNIDVLSDMLLKYFRRSLEFNQLGQSV